MEYIDCAAFDNILSILTEYNELVGTGLDVIFVPSLNIDSMDAFYHGLVNGQINDIRTYLDDIWHNHVISPSGFAVDAYATALCIIYHIIQTEAIQNGTVAEEISYIEYDYARRTLESMEYLITNLFDNEFSQPSVDEVVFNYMIHRLAALYQYNSLLMEVLSYCHPYATYDEYYRNLAIMAGDGWAAD